MPGWMKVDFVDAPSVPVVCSQLRWICIGSKPQLEGLSASGKCAHRAHCISLRVWRKMREGVG